MSESDFALGGRMGGRSQSDNYCSAQRDGEEDQQKAEYVEIVARYHFRISRRFPFEEDRETIDRIKLQIEKGRQNA